MPEVPIQGDQYSPFTDTCLKDQLIERTGKAFIVNGRDVMTSPPEKANAAIADILINFDFHSAGSTGTGMMRSLAASAP